MPGEFLQVGASRREKSDFRLLAASNDDVDALVRKGELRDDLVHRIRCVPIVMPPLRDHREDIPALASHFLQQCAPRNGHGRAPDLSAAALDLLMAHVWPGNVRELRNAIRCALALADGAKTLEVEHFPSLSFSTARASVPGADIQPLESTLRQTTAMALQKAVAATNGNLEEAAHRLGISRATMYSYVDDLKLELSALGWAGVVKRGRRRKDSA